MLAIGLVHNIGGGGNGKIGVVIIFFIIGAIILLNIKEKNNFNR